MKRIFNIIKSVWVVFWWAVGSFILWFPIGITGMFSKTGNLSFRLCQVWMLVGNLITFVRVTARGGKNLDKTRSYVIIANHQSFLDIPALMLRLGLQFRWVIKKEFAYVPLFGWGLFLAKHIFIDRSSPKNAIAAMDAAVKRLPKGVSVAVFAEGSRSNDGVVREFKPGGFLTAIRCGLPILPVTVNGSWRIMPDKKSLVFYPGPIELVVGEPIETAGCTRKDLRELIEKTRNAVVANLDPDFPDKRSGDSGR